MAFESVGTFLRRLALVAVGLSAGDAGAMAGALERIPERVLLQALQLGDDDGSEDDQRALMLELLALDARPGVRCAVADECAAAAPGELPWARRTTLLRRLACDDSPQVRRAVASGLGQLLRSPAGGRAVTVSSSGPSSWDRLETTVAWASDPDARVRQTLARALPDAPAALGARTALAALLDDPSPAVRAEAARALRRI